MNGVNRVVRWLGQLWCLPWFLGLTLTSCGLWGLLVKLDKLTLRLTLQTDLLSCQNKMVWGLGQSPDCLCGQIYLCSPRSIILHVMGVEGNPTQWEHWCPARTHFITIIMVIAAEEQERLRVPGWRQLRHYPADIFYNEMRLPALWDWAVLDVLQLCVNTLFSPLLWK